MEDLTSSQESSTSKKCSVLSENSVYCNNDFDVGVEFKEEYQDVEIKDEPLNFPRHSCELEDIESFKSEASDREGEVESGKSKEKLISCVQCNYSSNNKHYLRSHVLRVHIKEKNFKCLDCSYITNYRSILNSHIAAVHLKKEQFKCLKCNYIAYRKNSLNLHISNVHLKEKKFSCLQCNYLTNYRGSLKTHVAATHSKQYKFSCLGCNYSTNHKGNLNSHVSTVHLKQFTSTQLQVHLAYVHSKEKKYRPSMGESVKPRKVLNKVKCLLCKYATNKKILLRKHLACFHPNDEMVCWECNFSTYKKDHFNQHLCAFKIGRTMNTLEA